MAYSSARISAFFFAAYYLLAPAAFASSGLPAGLPAESYVQFPARALIKPKVIWLQPEWTRKLLKLDPSLSRPDIEQIVLAKYGFVTWASDGTIVSTRVREFLADRYGSVGLNGNLGAARVMEDVDAQAKGGGTNPLLGPQADEFHRDGKLPMTQALKEGLWSMILDQELPFGSNHTIAVIDTGDVMPTHFGTVEPCAIVVRENPLRPAHFMINPHAIKIDAAAEEERVSKVRAQLQVLWSKRLGFDKTASFKDLFSEFTRRVGAQYGYGYAHGIHHGGASPSNIDLDGSFLDLSTMTMVDGFQPTMGWDLLPHGDTELPFKYIVQPFLEELRKVEPGYNLPSSDEIHATLVSSFNETLDFELLRRAGFSETDASKLKSSESAKKFVAAIRAAIETHRGENRNNRAESPPRAAHEIDVQALLLTLSTTVTAQSQIEAVTASIENVIQDAGMRSMLASSYLEMIKSAGSSPRALSARGRRLNRNRDALFRRPNDHAFVGGSQIVTDYLADHNGAKVEDAVNQIAKQEQTLTDQPVYRNQSRARTKAVRAQVSCEMLFDLP